MLKRLTHLSYNLFYKCDKFKQLWRMIKSASESLLGAHLICLILSWLTHKTHQILVWNAVYCSQKKGYLTLLEEDQ